MSVDFEKTAEKPPIKDLVTCILEEARMVLPGIQALFGFQLIAVFNQTFSSLTQSEKTLHLAAIVLTMIAIGLLLGPAAYDRQRQPHTFSTHFVKIATKQLEWGLVPFALSMCLDLYLIANLILDSAAIASAIAGVALTFYFVIWFCYPRFEHWRHYGN